ncbi:pyridoxal phosphate-dependent aminotransferase [Fibrobacter sp. UWP2]|uniref:pyridoxal phosphate-dependent aminotransferase n=1 Tax=Fibrobacter sp. UWP2 TaxID=1896216 RepID=UPI0009152F38|nr:pyridoxal phosphate-dependent aminotransferase [Fibrobacter sp. UWP2]SHJ14683.1 aspartate aminotransferase [Fibrobacter sp. UWP2]
MTRPLSERTQNIAASLTVAIDTLAKQMIAEGKDVVSLGAGEPDFATPKPICEAACKAIHEGKTRYTPPVGILEVRKAVSEKLARENGLHYKPEQIIMTSGAKHAVFNSLAALVNPGDEVIVPAPYWVTYPELVKWLGGKPVFVQGKRENDFKITAEQLKAACNERTKAILLNNPCNPTGSVYSKQELAALARVIVAEDIYCISDEVYEYFVYDTEFTSAAAFEGMEERTIVINGFSKSHCMTGWRIGYNAAPAPIAKIIGKIQGQATHHPSNIAQYAALGALSMGMESVNAMRAAFKKRRDYMLERASKILKTPANAPQGAFYLFAPVSDFYGTKTPSGKTIGGSVELCQYLLESEGLAIVPGAAFGDDSCVRFSYAASDEMLQKACDRFKRGLKNLV